MAESNPLLKASVLKSVAAGATAGLLLTLALPPFGVSLLAWCMALPLLLVCVRRPPAEAIAAAYACGLVASSQAIYGVFAYNQFIAVFLLLVCPLWIVLPVSLLIWCRRSALSKGGLLLVPFFWVAADALFLEVFSLPLDTSVTLARNLAVVQFASVLGSAGLTFAVVLTATLTTLGIIELRGGKSKLALRWLGLAMMVPVSLQLLGRSWLGAPDASCLVDAQLAQPVIPISQSGNSWMDPSKRAEIRRTAWRYLDMAAESSAQVFVWPEGSSGFTSFRIKQEADKYIDYARKTHKHLLITATDIDEQGRRFNALFGISPAGIISKYNKSKLVPGSERDTVAGNNPGVAATAFGAVGIGICFEACFPNHMRQAAAYDPVFLLVSTSDVIFGVSSMPELHLSESIVRAVENRRSVVHVANGGPSAIIDPYGRLLKKTRLLEQTLMQGCVPGPVGQSLFTDYGYYFRYICVFVSLMVFVLAGLRRLNRRTNTFSIQGIAIGYLTLGFAISMTISVVMVTLSAWLVSRQAAIDLSLNDIVVSLQPSEATRASGHLDYISPKHMSVTALMNIASYYGVGVTADEILKDDARLYVPMTPREMAQAARDIGFTVRLLDLDAENIPVVIGVKSSGSRYGVLYAISDEGALLFDPILGLVRPSLTEFYSFVDSDALQVQAPARDFVRGMNMDAGVKPGIRPLYY